MLWNFNDFCSMFSFYLIYFCIFFFFCYFILLENSTSDELNNSTKYKHSDKIIYSKLGSFPKNILIRTITNDDIKSNQNPNTIQIQIKYKIDIWIRTTNGRIIAPEKIHHTWMHWKAERNVEQCRKMRRNGEKSCKQLRNIEKLNRKNKTREKKQD